MLLSNTIGCLVSRMSQNMSGNLCSTLWQTVVKSVRVFEGSALNLCVKMNVCFVCV